MENQKIALLDTDFTVKSIMSQKDSEHHLIDLLIQYSDYQYACHSKTVEEIQNHDFSGAYGWTQDKIEAGIICAYSDEDILDILSSLYGEGSITKYVQLLKKSCDAFSPTRFQEKFASLSECPGTIGREEFLQKLYACDEAYGRGKGLGEVKLLVLLQTLEIIHPGKVDVFCSDDGGARTGVFSTARVHCISVISLFYHLKNWGLKAEEAEPYYQTYEKDLPATQTTFKVYNEKLTIRKDVPCREVFDNIFLDKYEVYGTGAFIEKE